MRLNACQRCTFKNLEFHNFDSVVGIFIRPTVDGVAMNNAPGCIFVGLASDNQWDGNYFYNPLNVEVYVWASWMHFLTSDASAGTLQNRLASITQHTMSRQSGAATVGSGVTSMAVVFPNRMYVAPVNGKGEIRLTPYSEPWRALLSGFFNDH
ncbi:hypothetical protein [Bradyrhizobium elkanii]|uniref:hypothetical protein n=1 Tax=Bradyrhizobium elkanii TaxID=29448 RepID=UPI000841ADB7|nr:hypothetical protein [Bradyrhizobium elkanii]ODM75018.1 hypothetical protein A6452_38855 [Bradyrhizobium elkanii]ODM82796.1 hypothetical protein A6X20_16905 [Bradyrhizobium elkanii]